MAASTARKTTRTTSASKNTAAKSSTGTTAAGSKKTTATTKKAAAPQPTALQKAQTAAMAEVAELEAELTRLDNADTAADKAAEKRNERRAEISTALRQFPKAYRTTTASTRPARKGSGVANAVGSARQALGAGRDFGAIGKVLLIGFGIVGGILAGILVTALVLGAVGWLFSQFGGEVPPWTAFVAALLFMIAGALGGYTVVRIITDGKN